ncbi:MAG: hypothetical protein ACHQIL_04375 [Steroidobacterales bacterium]
MNLSEAAKQPTSNDVRTKGLWNYGEYDSYFSKNGIAPKSILEVSVYKGESTKVFATCFPDAKTVAIDLTLQNIDFSAYLNVKYLECDQTDKERLESIIHGEFPEGLDFILDDASHLGAYSALTFNITFPFLRGGSVYIVDDWGTGYWDNGHDGGRYQKYPLNFHDDHYPRRIPGHEFDMVGFVKSPVDLMHESAIKPTQSDLPLHRTRINSLRFSEGNCGALKA